ncbi:MAG: signal recognition particle receptor subunit alpha, partial [Acidobacteria bacterium]|nr:signal recognition particle receptor subunit alpha [Acidobacteriota bacterium]
MTEKSRAPETRGDERLEIAPEAQIPETLQRRGFWGKLKRGLLMTHTELLDKVGSAIEGRATLDQDTLEYLEEVLISADLGVETALELVEAVKSQVRPGQGGDIVRIREILSDEMAVLLLDAPKPAPRTAGVPLVTLMVGVNGVGKTTSIAKLARRALDDGERVLLAAGDTFRAAAVEQLQLWGRRLGVDVIRQNAGADPAAV